MIRILQLDKIKPGDVILETGIPKIGEATGGPYGHAALALGRLVKVEADLKGGVLFAPFVFTAYRRENERVVGVLVQDDDMVVLRRNPPLDLAELDARALLEAGRRYSLAKAMDLKDLAPDKRMELAEALKGWRAISDPEGRICSEVVAQALKLADKLVSPNMIAKAPELRSVEDAMTCLEDDWSIDPTHTATDVLNEKISALETGLAKRAMDLAKEGVAALGRYEKTKDDVVDELNTAYTDELKRSLSLLRDIRALEPTILHTGIKPI